MSARSTVDDCPTLSKLESSHSAAFARPLSRSRHRKSQSGCRILGLPPTPWQVLGADLNCSESRRRAACPSMMPAQAPNFAYSCQASTEHFEQCAEIARSAVNRSDHLTALAPA